jgi:carbon monoxide dehydrogenase subunit G
MELADEIIINASKEQVYAALNDPEILQQCIPGCEELIKHSDTELEAKVLLKVGPVKARFGGNVELDTSGAPDAFSLTGQGSGGTAGHAKGGADVTLTANADGTTTLRYDAKADIGGKLAQLGSRLIQGTAKKLAAKFFKSLANVFNADATT